MKNLLNFKRLWTDSHEKQSPQRFARYAVILIMLLTLGVGQMWATDYLYLAPNNDWKSDGARFAAYFFNNAETASSWVDMTKVTDDLYGVAVPASNADKVIFCRMNGSTSANNWDNKWSQTGNLTVSGNTGKQYNITGWDSGNWGSVVSVFTASSTLYLLPNSDWKSGARFAACFLGATEQRWVNCSQVGSSDYYSVTVPTNSAYPYVVFCRMKAADATNSWDNPPKWNQTANLAPTAGKNGVEITGWDNSSEWIVVYDGLSATRTPAAAAGTPTIGQTLIKSGSNVSVSAASANTGYHFVNWTSSNGSFATATNASTTFSPTAKNAVAQANYAENTYTITYKDQGNTDYSGSNEGSLPNSYTYGTGITTLTNGIKSGYNFLGWYEDSGCTGSVITTISTTATGNKTLYAKWEEIAGGSVQISAGTGGQVSKDNSSWGTSATITDITSAQNVNIYARANTGYTFNTWTRDAGTGSITTNAATGVYAAVAYETAELTASFTETMSTLTTSNSYNAGNPSYAAPTVFGSATNVGYSTTRTITATAAGTGYTFAGWTLTNCTRTDGGADDATSITIRSNGDGLAATAQANYTEDLTQSTWVLKGGTSIAGSDNWSTEYALTKKTGHSTESIVYYTLTNVPITPEGAQTTYNFKIVQKGNSDTYWGLPTDNDASDYWYMRSTGEQAMTNVGGDHNNIQLRADVVGDYEIKVDYSGVTPKITVTFPTSYTVNFGVSPTGAADAPTNDKSVSNGGLVLNGTSVIFTAATANTGYTWSHWEKNGANVGTSNTYTTTIGAATTMTAVYTENSYATTVSATNGSVSPASPNISHHTGTALTATPNTNYVFESWSVSGGGLTIVGETNANPGTFKATSTGGTITANFADQWSVCGIPNFSTWNGLPLKSGTVYEGTIHLTAGNYTFKVVDRKTNTWYTEPGKTITRAANTASATTTTGTDNNITITADKEGDYTFTFNTSDQSLTVTYPVDPTYTVTVTAGTHGSITTPAAPATTVSAGEFTPATIVAHVDDYGYYFQGWTVVSGSATIADASNLNTTVTATSAATIKANFVSHWTIAGGDSEESNGTDAMGDWSTVINGIDNFEEIESGVWQGYVDIVLPANTTFYFKVRDLYDGSAWYGNTGEMTYGNSTNWLMTKGSSNCRITTAGAGKYRFTWNETTLHLTVTYPDSYTVTYGKVANNGQNIGGVTVTGDDGATLETGKYVAKGSATFTAADAANYTFVEWRTSNTYGEGTQLSTENPYTMTSIAENKTVYAHYAENMTTVTLASTAGGHIEIGGATVTSTTAGAVTTRSLTPVANTGYYFAGWTKTACTDYSISGAENSEDNTTITLTGLGTGATSGETLTANFVELEKVYFRNWNEDSSEPLWENVYAYFSISYENDGEGKSCAKSNSSSDYSGILMTQEGTSNVYWAYVPRGTTRNNDDDIAFSNHNFGTNYKFHGHDAVMRGDYKTGWDMFVPQHGNVETKNTTTYYNGYWKHHNVAVGTDAGYRIVRYNGSTYVDPADNGDGSEDHRNFTIGSENTIIYQLRVDNLTTANHNNYMIYNVGSTNYITFGENVEETGYTITNTDCSNIGLSEYNSGSPRFYITPTSEGIYTLTIDMSGDVMRLSVTYPVAVGDYMLVHSYNNGSAKTHYSDIIKSTEVSERRYSMYIDSVSSDSPSLTLKKCIDISEGNPVWSTGTAVNMSSFTANTKGVYVFDVAIANEVATLSHIEAYTGNYYIKTDCATGGWTAYTQNVMEKNNATFSATDASTYDYLYCKWVDSGNGGDGGGTNVKCVIANDYCIAVSDTLEGDAILGGAQVLPRAANVRFSYNSTTNTLKRTYINGATGWESSFLSLTDAKSDFEGTGDDMITHFDGTALNNDTLSFVDKNNWIYQRDLKAKPGTRIRLTANYKYSDKDHQQYLIGDAGDLSSSTTVQIIGGTTDEFIPMRAIYDFKTNNLIVGYLASDEEVTKTRALYADVLIVREDQEDAAQITFGDNVQFTEVDTVYGIIEFNKSTILDETKSIYERSLYWISFPFDVNLNEAFGFGEYGKHWMIQYYDGASRAQNGFWAEVETYWKWITPAERKAGFVLEANKGYLLGLDLDEMTSSSTVWGNSVTSVSLYFPSKGSVGTIESPLASSKSVSVTAHECTIERDDRWYKDANWNVIGVPSYANITKTVVDGTTVAKTETLVTQDVPFLYTHDMTDNTLEAVASSEVTFKSMQAYVVQYAGTIDWTVATTPFAAPKRTPEQNGERNLTLNLSDDNDAQDHTFIRFTYEEGITKGLDMNKDLTKEFKPTTNIYSLVQGRASQVQLAANLLPADYTSTTVEIGVRVAQTGYYTFSMPSTDGLSVVLYDRMTGTRTNLLIGTYRTELSAGTTNGRFVLEIGNAQAPTFIQSVDTDANGERVIKFVQDGQLYILKNGRVFNAEGKAIE